VAELLSGVSSASSMFIVEKSAFPTPTITIESGKPTDSTMRFTVASASEKGRERREGEKDNSSASEKTDD